jgi:hypothetical protein
MRTRNRIEARLHAGTNLLITSSSQDHTELRDFFGVRLSLGDCASISLELSRKSVYLCGDLSRFAGFDLRSAKRIFVIREFSHGSHEQDADELGTPIGLGQVPLLVHGVGVYYRRFFEGVNHFTQICAEHTFQILTESTKPGKAHRTGIYLTPVQQDRDELHFRLLRCSTNLSGPTENFRPTDTLIVDALNREAAFVFADHAPLNHVLAQVYHNTPALDSHKQAKAKISAHADKTKDMPSNGIMAFCTFYDQLDKLQPLTKDPFDFGHKGISGLTKLHFRLKEPLVDRPESELPQEFTLTLYPNSVFFMPLSTNRLYTHEIRSSMLDAELLPTRLGYVVRCSKTEAVHREGQTFLKTEGKEVRLDPPTPEGMSQLRRLYAEENKTSDIIDYGDPFLFSMNTGDYVAPRI